MAEAEAKALIDTIADRLAEVEDETLVDILGKVEAKTVVNTRVCPLSRRGRRTWQHPGHGGGRSAGVNNGWKASRG